VKLCTLSFSKRGTQKRNGRKKVLESSIGKGVSGAPYTYSIVIIYHYAIGKLWLATCTRNKILAVTISISRTIELWTIAKKVD
jgi:hypothetical protein